MESEAEKLERFQRALRQFIERAANDRNVLAVVLVGSLSIETIWERESLHLWIVETDGVSLRLRSDGNDERIFRILVEEGTNIHAEVIPRSRFRQMVEGTSRTAFSCNFFARREIVYCADPSINSWFESANSVAVKDQERELLTFSSWTIYAIRRARKMLAREQELDLAWQQALSAAHSIAYLEVIRAGEVWEREPIHRAMAANPELFHVIYTTVLASGKQPAVLQIAIDRIDRYLDEHYRDYLKPVLHYLRKAGQTVPLSVISDHFAYSQIHPWHIEAACEWLEQRGHLQKLSSPFKLTKRSQESVEEPAYFSES